MIIPGSVELKGDETKVKGIIQVWLNNVASIDRRLRLLEKMQKEHEAKISAQPFVRFHSDFVGQLLMSESLGIAKVISQCLKNPQKFSILRAKRAAFISKKPWVNRFCPL